MLICLHEPGEYSLKTAQVIDSDVSQCQEMQETQRQVEELKPEENLRSPDNSYPRQTAFSPVLSD